MTEESGPLNDRVSIRFLGAAGTVTGSKHLLKTPQMRILVDCGLFQGIKPLRERNWESLPEDPAGIDAVILTHAHLDHCGYLPLLVKNGFKGKVYMSAPTRDITEIILLDSATLQEEDAERANEYGYSKHKPALPLYTREDVINTLPYFSTLPSGEWLSLSADIRFRFRRNGHILGACFVEMDCYGKMIVFSGDIGRKNALTMPDPEKPDRADFLVIESTYGNRLHPDMPAEQELAEIINDTLHRHGNILISSFAVGRAQELMELIHILKKEIMIPDVEVCLDSPMGERATEITLRHKDWQKLSEEECREAYGQVRYIQKLEDSYRLMKEKKHKIVIAASGMLSGGRVLHYLKEYLPDPKNTIMLGGFQAEGTRGRDLQEGAHELRIHGEYYPVNAEIRELLSLSAHADRDGLLDWLSEVSQEPQQVFVVHGEPSAAQSFRSKLEHSLSWNAVVPELNEEFELFTLNKA